jgi:hypothetical protein
MKKRKPKGFGKFDNLMRKLVKVPPEDVAPSDGVCGWCTSPYSPLHKCGSCGEWVCASCMETHICEPEEKSR